VTVVMSDCAPLAAAVGQLIKEGIALHCLRDLTRGGLATALIEIAEVRGATIAIEETAIPVSDPCAELLRFSGLIRCMSRMRVGSLRLCRRIPSSERSLFFATLVTQCRHWMRRDHRGFRSVRLKTIGGTRCLDMLTGEQLPRIC
jgi:hydrogenase expression/formation protein HypE